MLHEEYGLALVQRKPWLSGLSTFLAFILCGSVPLLPFVLPVAEPYALSLGMTLLVFFAIGSIKSRWSLAAWWRSGLETLAIGTGAAILAYGVGHLLGGLAS